MGSSWSDPVPLEKHFLAKKKYIYLKKHFYIE